MAYRLGVDVGGTFTDLFLVDARVALTVAGDVARPASAGGPASPPATSCSTPFFTLTSIVGAG